jgi:AIPR protein
MNINAGIIDQQVRGLAQRLGARIADALGRPNVDDTMARSTAFVVLCAKVMLDLSDDEAIDAVTDGGNDFGADAIELSDVSDGEFAVTLFQGKYHHENLEGVKAFPQSGVEKAVQAVRALFNPAAPVDLNPRLQAQIEEVRSLIVDGNIPRVRFLLCSNGAHWKLPEAQAIIDREQFGERAVFEHVNHDTLVRILQSTAPVKDVIQFAGKAIVEDYNYARVFLGKVPVAELARLMDSHGDRLLERNIRRYLGLHGNRVNEAIARTLRSAAECSNFYFYNNGITLICDRFDYNALQPENHKVRVEGLQIINGGQTSKTIQSTLAQLAGQLPNTGREVDSAFVLVRLYQVPSESAAFVQTITYATNSQNPVDLKDLRSNDERQKQLELSVRDLGYEYRRQRAEGAVAAKDITVGVAAEAVLSVWRGEPQLAKLRTAEHFGKLYDRIFSRDLNGAQLVTAMLLFRIAESKRRHPPPDAPDLVRYGSCFAAMLMGQYLLIDLRVSLERLDHRNFEQAKRLIESEGERYFSAAVAVLEGALRELYGGQPVSLQRLAATFRRGDLLAFLVESVREARIRASMGPS